MAAAAPPLAVPAGTKNDFDLDIEEGQVGFYGAVLLYWRKLGIREAWVVCRLLDPSPKR